MSKKYIIGGVVIILVILVGVIMLQPAPADAPELSGAALVEEQAAAEGDMTDKAMQDETGVIVEDVVYYESATGYLARPEAEGTYPGLILIHEWWGLNEDIRSIAQRFAAQGYVALAVDLYDGQVTQESSEARVLSSAVRDDVAGAFENLGAALDYLRERPEVKPDKLASVGWCFGGGWAYQMALNDLDIEASVMYYGQFNPDDDFDMMRADILGHFGEADASIAVDNVRQFQAALETTNGAHEVFIYPNVGHGFANERGGDNLAYSVEEAELAWQRTQDFLGGGLREPAMEQEPTEPIDAMEEEIKEFGLSGVNFEFSEKEIRVKQGAKVRINFSSADGLHDWVIDEFGAATERVSTGGSASVEFIADRAGTYEYYCSVGRHREFGMVGTLIVE